MKKKLIGGFSLDREKVRKIWMTMRLIVLLFFVSLIHVSASVYSQKTKLNIRVENATLQQVFKVLQEQSEFDFFYKNEQIPADARVSIETKNETIEVILNKVLTGTGLTYHVLDKDIVISSKGAAKSEMISQQQKSVSGKVTDSSGASLPGVSVVVKGTTNGTITDGNGNYSLNNVPENATVQFSFVGMKGQEVAVGGKTTINVSLAEDAIGIEEVVAIGYGTMRKSDLTGSVTSVSSTELAAYPALGATQALQGRASGVMVTSRNGEPGTEARIRIRGGTSINASSEPLYVVDGFAGGNVPAPEDIQSIEILKDASATAIYGSRGANGVVLVTTKRGKAGKTNIELNSSYSVQQLGKKLDMLNGQEFAELMNDMYKNDGLTAIPYPNPQQYGVGTDWQDEIFRTGILQNYQLSASGGKENFRFYTSANYYGNKGTVINSNFNRISALTNLDVDFNDHIKFGTKMNFTRTTQDGVRTQEASGGTTGTGVVSAALKFEPVQGVYDENGMYTRHKIGDPHDNPVAIAMERQNNMVIDVFQGNSYAEIDLMKDLKFRSTVGVQILNSRNGLYIPTILKDGENFGGIGSISSNKNTILLNENYLTYNKAINDLNKLNFMAGYSYQSNRSEYWNASNQNFITNSFSFWNLGGGSRFQNPSSSLTQWVLASFYGRLNYNFANKYLLTFTGRYDGSSRFGANHKWAFFPSGAFAWNVKEEPFMKKISKLSHLKLRTSYGMTGNTEIGSYRSLALFRPSTTVIDGTPVNAIMPSTVANKNLTWESTSQTDVGLDVGLFNERLIFTADYYYKKTEDLLYNVPLPEYSGYTTSLQNMGSVLNKGWEFSVSTVNLNGSLKWDTDFNISFNRNKILDLAGGDVLYSTVPGHMLSSDSQVLREGEVIGAFYGWIFDGVYQQGDNFSAEPNKKPGNIKYRDVTGRDASGKLDGKPNGVVNMDDRVIIGNPHPDFIFGLNNDFKYKNFDLNIFIHGSVGNDMMNYTRMELDWLAGKSNATKDALNRWTPTNINTDVPMASGGNKAEVSTRWVEDGSYVRLKNIALGYNLQGSILQRFNLSSLRVYMSAQNFFTFTKYSGYDPEVSFRDSNTNVGLDYGSYPNVKSLTIGVNIGL
ncbi:MAG: TonB-dependent receptor [Bacteroidota bacterium]|nr:TonB-dependent receptor [Bacteroidota bacterium]